MLQEAQPDHAADAPRSASASLEGPDPLAELAASLGPGPFALVLLFAGEGAELPQLLARAPGLFGRCALAGCTTAGEVGAAGYADRSLVAVAFPETGFAARTVLIDPIDAVDTRGTVALLQEARQDLWRRAGEMTQELAILLVDGISGREEHLVASLAGGLGPVRIVGGSAGDWRAFRRTQVFCGQQLRERGAAVLCLLRSRMQMRGFSFNSARPSRTQMVVTRADPAARVVLRINDEPAAREYARLLDRTTADLGPELFATRPVMVRAGGRHFVRAIRGVGPEDSLMFFGAVAEGMVLTLAEESDMVAHLADSLAGLAASATPRMVLGFDCIFRRIDAESRQQMREISALLARHRVAGFSTYGEQTGGDACQPDPHRRRLLRSRGAAVTGRTELPADIARMLGPGDDAARRHEKLVVIAQALIRHIEDPPQDPDGGYAQFQRAAVLEDEVRARTRELEHALDLLNASNASLSQAYREKEAARQNLSAAIEAVQEGFALFDARDVLVMCNSRFNAMLPDILDRLQPGLDFETYLRLVSSSRHFTLPDGLTREGWIDMRRQRHAERHFILTQEVAEGRLVQVSEQRTADGGTAILQTEVTELIRAERAERGRLLDDQAAILKATLEHLPLGVCLFDGRLRLLAWNSNLSQMLALPLTRLRAGAHFDELWHQLRAQFDFPAQLSANRLADWARSVRRRDSFGVQVTREAGAEGPRTLALHAQEIPDGGFVLSIDDITDYSRALDSVSRANETLEARVAERTLELQDALAQAERANASRARFVAAVGHDLMQPLSAATLFVGSLFEDVALPAPRAKLEKIQRSLDSVSGLIEALLDISRLEAGQAALTVEPVALAPLFEQLREEFTPVAQQKGLQLVVRPAHGTVMSDRSYLRRILQNLLSNAIRYTDAGRVLVAARPRPGRVLLQVRDTGRGIAAKNHRLVFDEFKRLDAKASASEGLGLGLAIVDRATALLGHSLTLRSAPGRGSTFSVEAAATRLLSSDRGGATALLPGDTERPELTALVVENDTEMMQALTQLLEQWGVNVLDVPSGEEAVALLDETGVEPELCILDYQLGAGMDGLDCLRQIRARLGEVSRYWLMSADRSEALQSEAAGLGITLLSKPISPATLARIVAEAGEVAR